MYNKTYDLRKDVFRSVDERCRNLIHLGNRWVLETHVFYRSSSSNLSLFHCVDWHNEIQRSDDLLWKLGKFRKHFLSLFWLYIVGISSTKYKTLEIEYCSELGKIEFALLCVSISPCEVQIRIKQIPPRSLLWNNANRSWQDFFPRY